MLDKLKADFLQGVILLLSAIGAVQANEVDILLADFNKTGNNTWSVNVTLKHKDTGWDHYADKWRVLDANNHVLGERVLYHPHVNEQPFTRSLGNVVIPSDVSTVYIEAHDKVHAWAAQRMKVDLNKQVDGRVRVNAK